MTSETNSTLKIGSIHILLKHCVYETNVTRKSFVKIEGFILFYFIFFIAFYFPVSNSFRC